jgi:hypothetical protein
MECDGYKHVILRIIYKDGRIENLEPKIVSYWLTYMEDRLKCMYGDELTEDNRKMFEDSYIQTLISEPYEFFSNGRFICDRDTINQPSYPAMRHTLGWRNQIVDYLKYKQCKYKPDYYPKPVNDSDVDFSEIDSIWKIERFRRYGCDEFLDYQSKSYDYVLK